MRDAAAAEGYVGGYRRSWWGIRRPGGGCSARMARRKGERESGRIRRTRANAREKREARLKGTQAERTRRRKGGREEGKRESDSWWGCWYQQLEHVGPASRSVVLSLPVVFSAARGGPRTGCPSCPTRTQRALRECDRPPLVVARTSRDRPENLSSSGGTREKKRTRDRVLNDGPEDTAGVLVHR